MREALPGPSLALTRAPTDSSGVPRMSSLPVLSPHQQDTGQRAQGWTVMGSGSSHDADGDKTDWGTTVQPQAQALQYLRTRDQELGGAEVGGAALSVPGSAPWGAVCSHCWKIGAPRQGPTCHAKSLSNPNAGLP